MERRRFRSPRLCVFPGYNWCGPGCSGPGAPVNAVDAACKAHDLCYLSYKRRCDCDIEFLDRLEQYIHYDNYEGRHARMLYRYMLAQTRFNCWRR
ncbi:phospholipase [Sporosarcina highlanderae]|uniref:Phospholipase n=1 Tax=Sporosarcina highlanderae TaxID=3035916 RepID=A0ABT8JSG2_9BACL|nr:phospholipase [Sporosarcina highlanderae]MDN4608080.1 phospholipase [Sporosarcina highlanderae]